MNPYDIKLPKDVGALRFLYILINERLNILWLNYTTYVHNIKSPARASLVFPILFNEIDCLEIVLSRIRISLPKDIVEELNEEYYYSDW